MLGEMTASAQRENDAATRRQRSKYNAWCLPQDSPAMRISVGLISYRVPYRMTDVSALQHICLPIGPNATYELL